MITVEQLTNAHPFSTVEEWQAVRDRCEAIGVEGLWNWVAQNVLEHRWSPLTASHWADTVFLAHQKPNPAELGALLEYWLEP